MIKVGSWSIMVIDSLRSLIGMSSTDFPSMNIFPDDIYVIPSSVLMIVVLPAPVLPTIPIFYPGLIPQVNPLITLGRSFLYLTSKS